MYQPRGCFPPRLTALSTLVAMTPTPTFRKAHAVRSIVSPFETSKAPASACHASGVSGSMALDVLAEGEPGTDSVGRVCLQT